MYQKLINVWGEYGLKIQSVRLENVTVFEDITINLSEGINIFIGKNGTGKTHLLKAIYGACESSVSPGLDINKYFKLNGFDGDLFRKINCNFPNKLSISLMVEGKHSNLSAGTEVLSVNMDDLNKYTKIYHHTVDGRYEIHLPANTIFNAAYIPVKDMLTHSKGLLAMMEKYSEFPFDKTLTDIISRANQWTLKEPPEIAKSILPVLENIIDGQVIIENDEFFIKKHSGQMVNFSVEAEGFKKIGLLWRLLMNESITKDSILIWDEPEANLNPDFLPNVVECLLELSRQGIQIILSTHNYIFAKYFDVRRKETDTVKFHSLYKNFENNVQIESKGQFHELNHNDIMTAFERLLNEVYNLK